LRLSSVRIIEAYCAIFKININIYQLYYKHTAEDYNYLQFATKEKDSFNFLLDLLNKPIEIPPVIPLKPHNPEEPVPVVAVDIREFSSQLPAHLYKAGIKIVPLMLSVGDYILSDEICIERKAVNTGDLFESITAGRLYFLNKFMKIDYRKLFACVDIIKSLSCLWNLIKLVYFS